MTSIWTRVRALVSVLALAAFALPVGAAQPQKIYSLNVSPLGTSPIQLTMKNETPNGNSTINSFIISPPAGVTITGTPTPSAPATVELRPDGKVYVNALDGLKAGTQTPKAITISLTATYPSSPACGTNYTWTAVVYTGNSFGMETFDLTVGNPPTSPTQTVNCKNYTVSMTPSSAAVGASSSLTAKFTNSSTSSGSFNSVTMTVPSGSGWSITNATLPGGQTATVSTLPSGGVTLSGITPAVAPGAFINVALQVSIPCTASNGTWTSAVGGGFALSGSNPSTTVTGACALVILAQPDSAVSGEPFAVKVGAVDGSSNPITSFAGPVTLTLNTISGSGVLAPGTSSATGGVVTFPGVTITGIGQFSLTASSSLGAASFSITTSAFSVFTGVILCGEAFDPLDISNPPNATKGHPEDYPPIPPEVGFARGKRDGNKDSSNCPDPGARIPYVFKNTIPTNNTVILEWDAIAAPYAVFRYQATLKDELVGADGLPSFTTLLLFPDTPGGTKIAHVGVACLSSDSAGKLGTLSAPITGTSNQNITINGIATVPISPIAIWVTSLSTSTGGERMVATQTNDPVVGTGPYSVTYSVTRGDGSTTPVPHPESNPQAFITPLPVDPNQYLPASIYGPNATNLSYNKQVSMCIISERWEAIGGKFLRPTVDAYDSGDGGISRAP